MYDLVLHTFGPTSATLIQSIDLPSSPSEDKIVQPPDQKGQPSTKQAYNQIMSLVRGLPNSQSIWLTCGKYLLLIEHLFSARNSSIRGIGPLFDLLDMAL